MSDPMTLFATMSTALTSAKDIAIGLSKLDKSVGVNAKAIELQAVILELQSAAFDAQAQLLTLTQRIHQLEEDGRRATAWDETKKRYALTIPWAGATVYALKRESAEGEAPHWICTKCFEDRRRAILNGQARPGGAVVYVCSTCKAEVPSPWRNMSKAQYAEDYKT